ncbi:MAG: tetratricopeptide repeat protein [Burkholderiales bacterium]|nr:tetratricopeptide repeat protein [Burkholderiales bacterium]
MKASLFRRSAPLVAAVSTVLFLLTTGQTLALPVPTQGVRPVSPGPGGATGDLQEAVAALRDKQPDQARKFFEAALRTDARSLPAMLGLAEVAFGQRNDAETLKWLLQAERIAPQSAEVQAALGRYHLSRKQFDKGEAALRKAIQLDPKAARARIDLAETLARKGSAAAALPLLQEAIALDGQHKGALLLLGQLQYQLGAPAEAEKALRRVAELDVKDPVPWLLMAGVAKTSAAAKPLLDEALQRDAKNYRALMLKAQWQVLDKDRSGAQDSLRRAADADPKSAEPWVRLGMMEEEGGRKAEAKRLYLSAIERDPHQPVALNNLVMMGMADKEDPARLETMAKRAAKALPDNAQVHDTLALVLRLRKDKAGALAAAQTAVKLAPKDAGLLATLADIQAWNGDRDAARRNAEEALKLQPQGEAAVRARAVLSRV